MAWSRPVPDGRSRQRLRLWSEVNWPVGRCAIGHRRLALAACKAQRSRSTTRRASGGVLTWALTCKPRCSSIGCGPGRPCGWLIVHARVCAGVRQRATADVLARLADWSCSQPRRVAVLGGLLFALVGVIGGPAPGSFSASNAFDDPGSQANRARERIERATGEAASAGVVALVRAPRSSAEVARVARTIGADRGIARCRSLRVQADRRPSHATVGKVLLAATLRAGRAEKWRRQASPARVRRGRGGGARRAGGRGQQTGSLATSSSRSRS